MTGGRVRLLHLPHAAQAGSGLCARGHPAAARGVRGRGRVGGSWPWVGGRGGRGGEVSLQARGRPRDGRSGAPSAWTCARWGCSRWWAAPLSRGRFAVVLFNGSPATTASLPAGQTSAPPGARLTCTTSGLTLPRDVHRGVRGCRACPRDGVPDPDARVRGLAREGLRPGAWGCIRIATYGGYA